MDAPYYEHKTNTLLKVSGSKDKIVDKTIIGVLKYTMSLLDIISYFWELKPSLWLEMGIVIYESQFGAADTARKFSRCGLIIYSMKCLLIRVGFTTWSANERMIKVGAKLGMTMEARLRKVRFVRRNLL